MSEAAPEPKANMGQPAPRVDARAKVTGEARYSADFPLANLAHAVLVTSNIARGRVIKLETKAAEAVPGLLAILSYGDADNLDKPVFGLSATTSIAPLAEPRIWHDGQIVALVVADTYEAAREAADRLGASYAAETPSAGFDSPGIETIAGAGNMEMLEEDPRAGDAETAFGEALIALDEEYSTPTQHHNPIELFSTTCAWEDGRLTVYESSQNVHGMKNALAKQLRIDPAKVRVVSPYIGGAFGSRGQLNPRTALVALAARRVGRPVRCVLTRRQGFTTTTYRAETRHRIRMAATPQGKITAYLHEAQELTSRADNYGVAGTETTSRMYGYGSVLTRVSLVKADRNTPGFMRSPPEVPYVFALETAMDEMAARVGLDPVEFRRINDAQSDPIEGKPFSSRHLMECYDAAAASFGWAQRNPVTGATRHGDWLVGMGCATAIYPTNTAPATARVRFSPDGKVRVESASHEIGTGIRTVAAQMAAERLGTDLDSVIVETGDTDLPPAPVSGGSISTASVCSAVMKACDAIRRKLFQAAVQSNEGPLSGRDPGALDMRDGRVVAPDGAGMAVRDLLHGAVEEYAEWIPDGLPPDAIRQLYQGESLFKAGTSGDRLKFAFGAEFVEVRVHARTGEIRVPRIVGAFTAGRIMNTRTARSQLMGGMIWGIGSALHEATEIDPRAARYMNANLSEYLVPVNADIDKVEVILLSEEDKEVNPAGIKGLGELGNVGTAAALSNAVYHATGRRIRHLPIRLDALLV